MTTHPSEDDLILRFYGEGDAAGEAAIASHLRGCAACRDLWEELGRTMQLVDRAGIPEPPLGFERVMWARVQPALTPRTRQFTWRRVAPALSLAAVVVILLTLTSEWRGVIEEPDSSSAAAPSAPAAAADPSQVRERVLLTALDDHFAQTELLLVELMNAPEDAAPALGFERNAADDLVASGRLFRVTAKQAGNFRLVQMLEDLEPVLVEVARSPETVDRRELNSLRSRIDDNGLLFKVRAVTNDIRERQQEIVTANEGGI